MSHYFNQSLHCATPRPRHQRLGFWESFADVGLETFAESGADFATWDALPVGDFDTGMVIDYASDYASDFSTLATGDFIPADYAGDLQYQYADAIDNFSGDVDAGAVIDGEYVPADYAGDAQYEYADQNDYVNSPATDTPAPPAGNSPLPTVSVPAQPGGNTAIPPASRPDETITRSGGTVLDQVLTRTVELTPRILDVVTTTQKRQAEIDNRQAELDRWRDTQARYTALTPGGNPVTSRTGIPAIDALLANVKENPMPWAIGAGALALLLFAKRSKSRKDRAHLRERLRKETRR